MVNFHQQIFNIVEEKSEPRQLNFANDYNGIIGYLRTCVQKGPLSAEERKDLKELDPIDKLSEEKADYLHSLMVRQDLKEEFTLEKSFASVVDRFNGMTFLGDDEFDELMILESLGYDALSFENQIRLEYLRALYSAGEISAS